MAIRSARRSWLWPVVLTILLPPVSLFFTGPKVLSRGGRAGVGMVERVVYLGLFVLGVYLTVAWYNVFVRVYGD